MGSPGFRSGAGVLVLGHVQPGAQVIHIMLKPFVTPSFEKASTDVCRSIGTPSRLPRHRTYNRWYKGLGHLQPEVQAAISPLQSPCYTLATVRRSSKDISLEVYHLQGLPVQPEPVGSPNCGRGAGGAGLLGHVQPGVQAPVLD